MCDISGECWIFRFISASPRPIATHKILDALGVPRDFLIRSSVARTVFFYKNPEIDHQHSIVSRCLDMRCVRPDHIAVGVLNPPRASRK